MDILSWRASHLGPSGSGSAFVSPVHVPVDLSVKLIAYRAETAMMTIVREILSREDDARSLLRDLFRTDANLTPDIAAGVLRVSVHGMANPRSNRAIRHLLDELNAAEFTFPGTDLKLEYSLLGSPAQPPQDETEAN